MPRSSHISDTHQMEAGGGATNGLADGTPDVVSTLEGTTPAGELPCRRASAVGSSTPDFTTRDLANILRSSPTSMSTSAPTAGSAIGRLSLANVSPVQGGLPPALYLLC